MMKKRVRHTVMFILLLVLTGLMAYLIPYEIKIETNRNGVLSDFNEDDFNEVMNVAIRGTAEYRFFQLKVFEGQFIFSEPSHPWNDKSLLIHFYEGMGHVKTYDEAYQLSSKKEGGYVLTKDFEELLVLFQDSESTAEIHRFFAAPAQNREESRELAKRLSRGTWLAEVLWD